jgi:ABC-2 type transport system permease protein
MTTTTVSHAPLLTTASIRLPAVLPHLLRSEWAKLASVRSTYWNLVVAAAAIVVVGVVAAISAAHSHTDTVGFDPVSNSLGGVMVAQLAIGVLGVLTVTSEYSTGMIRSTFAAAPQRGTLIAAKAAVFGAIAFAVGLIASLVTFLVGQAILGSQGVSLGTPGALRAVIGVGAYLGLLGVLAIGLGTVIRRSAGAIAVLVGLLLVIPALAPLLPTAIRDTVGKFLPYIAGQAIFNTTTNDNTTLSPWAGLAVFALYAILALAIAIVLIRHRDA